MSITFTPLKNTFTTHHYYVEQDGSIYDSTSEEPSVQCHNSGGYTIIQYFGLVPNEDHDDAYCGSVTCEDAMAMLVAATECKEVCGNPYIESKLHLIEQMLLHCKLHECGFNWG